MAHNPAFQHLFIPALARSLVVSKYLELGCADGAVLRGLRELSIPVLIGVDKVLQQEINGIQFFQMTTQEFIAGPIKEFAPFDLVFIDADHDENAVSADFWGVFPYVRDDGIILLHDTYPDNQSMTDVSWCGTAYRFARKLTYFGDIEAGECVTLPMSPGLTIYRKRKQFVPWEAN